MRSFVALRNFYSPEIKSGYVEGLSYTILPGNRYLGALAEVRALEGKIEFIHRLNEAKLYGIGKVNDETFSQKTKAAWVNLWR
jgi:hypothetical protein